MANKKEHEGFNYPSCSTISSKLVDELGYAEEPVYRHLGWLPR